MNGYDFVFPGFAAVSQTGQSIQNPPPDEGKFPFVRERENPNNVRSMNGSGTDDSLNSTLSKIQLVNRHSDTLSHIQHLNDSLTSRQVDV